MDRPAAALASPPMAVAGNLTVLGSVASLIELEPAGPAARIGFWRFLRSGVVVTGAPLLVGLAILLAERGLGLIWLRQCLVISALFVVQPIAQVTK